MAVITIREEGKTETGFQATLKFEAGEYQVTITNPFTPREEKRLEWYFEEWLVYPMLDTAKAEEAVTSVKTYGERLFEQVFQSSIKAYSEYDKLRNELSQVQIEIVSKTVAGKCGITAPRHIRSVIQAFGREGGWILPHNSLRLSWRSHEL